MHRYIIKLNVKKKLLFICVLLCTSVVSIAQSITGELKQWHKVTLTFDGPQVSESDATNPFKNYRLDITFTQGSLQYTIPGYYAADGDASNSSATSGNKWRAHFCPPTTGIWNYSVSFLIGTDVATAYPLTSFPSWSPLHGKTGSFTIQTSDKTGDDFRAKGWLIHNNEFFYRFKGNGEYFLKNGSDSPENFLGYYEFDNTIDNGGAQNDLPDGLHHFDDHLTDWATGDPLWKTNKGKRIIGAINYLGSQKVNTQYMVLMNVEGDGQEVYPWTSYTERERFDVSKLDQWEIVFEQMQKKGIALHLVFQEMENTGLLGGPASALKRLYVREMIARYAHHNALFWNIGEEYTRSGQSAITEATFVKSIDAYNHPCKVHTHNAPGEDDILYDPILGSTKFNGTSLQQYAYLSNSLSIKWREKSEAANWRWAVELDELVGGIRSDDVYYINLMRKQALWGNLMGGGAGIEWYLGYYQGKTMDDLDNEDFRKQQLMWTSGNHAIHFFKTYLSFWQMEPANYLLTDNGSGDRWVLAKEADTYAVYLSTGGNATISLPTAFTWNIQWYNPQTGVMGSSTATTGNLSAPDATNDWVALIKKNVIVVNSAPTINITSPSNYQVYGLSPVSVQLKANAFDSDGTITKVEFYNGNTKIGQNNNSPYSFTWNNITTGNYNIKAIAYDNSGNTTTSSFITITVDPNAVDCGLNLSLINTTTDNVIANWDTIRTSSVISTPVVGTNLNIKASILNTTVGSVQFVLDGTVFKTENIAPYAIGPETAGDYNNWNYTYGIHTLKTIVYSGTNATGYPICSSTISFEITATNTNQSPTINIIIPENNSIYNTGVPIPIHVDADDIDGIISKVVFFRDGIRLGQDAIFPYSFNQLNLPNGTYTITTKAIDNFGAQTTSSDIQFTVDSTYFLDIIGPDCGDANQTSTYEVSNRIKTNASQYNWWYKGTVQAVNPIVGMPYKSTVSFGPNPSSDSLCVGITYSTDPWYKSYCKKIAICNPPITTAIDLGNNNSNGFFIQLYIFDLMGREIFQSTLPDDFSTGLPPGIYIKKSIYTNTIHSEKIVIQ